jgi:hypothetical protein
MPAVAIIAGEFYAAIMLSIKVAWHGIVLRTTTPIGWMTNVIIKKGDKNQNNSQLTTEFMCSGIGIANWKDFTFYFLAKMN